MCIVNQPDFTLKVMHNGAQVWTTRIVIGKPGMQTPLLSETMKSITVNPTWNVPPSIVYNEYMPALQRDPTVLARMGLQCRPTSATAACTSLSRPARPMRSDGFVSTSPTGSWSTSTTRRTSIMFAHDVRAYSHGCMRVQDPAKYAEVLFNIARPERALDGREGQANVRRRRAGHSAATAQIWVHLTYQSAFVDDAGKLQIRRDVYNLDSRTLAAIKSERGIIEPPQERKREQEVAATSQRRPGGATPRVSFFEALFGGSAAARRKAGRCHRAASAAELTHSARLPADGTRF